MDARGEVDVPTGRALGGGKQKFTGTAGLRHKLVEDICTQRTEG